MGRIKRKNGYILTSILGREGLDCVLPGTPETLTVRIRNATRFAFRLAAAGTPPIVPRITIDFRGIGGDIFLDPATVSCRGFEVTSWRDQVLELSLRFSEKWFFPGDVLDVVLPDAVVSGIAGAGYVTVSLGDFGANADGRSRVTLVKLSAEKRGARFDATWIGRNAIRISRRGIDVPNMLTMRLDPGDDEGADGEVILSLAGRNGQRLLGAPWRLAAIEVTSGDGWNVEPLRSEPVPSWRLTRGSGNDRTVTLSNVTTDGKPGDSGLVVVSNSGFRRTSDGSSALAVAFDNGDLQFSTPLTADPSSLSNILAPTAVFLSWAVDNAQTVILSDVGVVNASQQRLQVMIEQTTTFVLTAFDSALDQIASSSVTVTVDPPLISRVVPSGTITLWSGTTTDIPAGWLLCDGTNSTPDLRDRFVVGAGTATPGSSGDADTHTHSIAALSNTFGTSTDGDHTHGFPGDWFARNLSSGDHGGIDTNGDFGPGTQSQGGGNHSHNVSVSFGTFDSGANSSGVRPPWYALCYVMKG